MHLGKEMCLGNAGRTAGTRHADKMLI